MFYKKTIANVVSVTLTGVSRVRRGRCLSRLASSVVRWPAETETFCITRHSGLGISPVSDETADAFQLLGRFLVTQTEDHVGRNHRGYEDLAGTRMKPMRIQNLKPGSVFDHHRRQAVSSSQFRACRLGQVSAFLSSRRRGLQLQTRNVSQDMKFRMFTDVENDRKIAVNVDEVRHIEEVNKGTAIWICGHGYDIVVIHVSEDFYTVFSRLNTIAE